MSIDLPSKTVLDAGDGSRPSTRGRISKTLLPISGLLAAIASLSCCVIPFGLFFVGVSGAWIGNLTALAPYQPYFIAVALALIGAGLFMLHRKPRAVCGDGPYCASPLSDRIAKIVFWVALALVIVAVAFPYLIGSYFGN